MKLITISLKQYIELLETKITFLSTLETDKTPEITKQIKTLQNKIKKL